MDPTTGRILDANANRAREGLRVMEDHCRFALDDAPTAERIKHLRHELSSLLRQAWPPGVLLAARNTQGDVGRDISTPQEEARTGTEAVVVAAARRVTEALRCLEEYAKCEHPNVARSFETMRYCAYEIEQALVVGGPRRRRLRTARLHVLITEALCRHDWLETANAVLAGGADVIQLREKALCDRVLLERARRLRELTASAGALLIVNDRPDIAALADADGVHVGQDDLPASAARRIVGPNRLVGLSTHSIEQFRAAIREDRDYVAVGPMFASSTKPQDFTPGPPLLAAALREMKNEQAGSDTQAAARALAIVAIGGITPERLAAFESVGEFGIAVCGAIIGAADPRAATAVFLPHCRPSRIASRQ